MGVTRNISIADGTARRARNIDTVIAMLADGQITAVDAAEATGVTYCTALKYLNELMENGEAHVARPVIRSGNGSSPAVWAAGPVPTVELSPDDDDEADCVPKFKAVTRWAHGKATRYVMGRAV